MMLVESKRFQVMLELAVGVGKRLGEIDGVMLVPEFVSETQCVVVFVLLSVLTIEAILLIPDVQSGTLSAHFIKLIVLLRENERLSPLREKRMALRVIYDVESDR